MPSKDGASVKQSVHKGCVGFPRAVLCSSSSEFLERSLLPCSWNSLDCRASPAVEVETQSVWTTGSTNKRVLGKEMPSKQTFHGPQTFITLLWRAWKPGTARRVAGFGKQGFGDVDLLCYHISFPWDIFLIAWLIPRASWSSTRLPWLILLCLHHFQYLCPYPFLAELYVLLWVAFGFVLIVVLAAPGISAGESHWGFQLYALKCSCQNECWL